MAVSGGKDSTFALHQVVARYGMHPLVLFYDNGFADEQSKRNLANAVRILGVDLIRNEDATIQKKYLRRNLLLLPKVRRQRLGRVLPILCTACNLGYDRASYDIAKKNGVTLILHGGNPVEPDLRSFWKPGAFHSSRVHLFAMMINETWELLTTGLFYNPLYWRNIRTHTLGWQYLLWSINRRFSESANENKQKGLPVKAIKDAFHNYIAYDENKIVTTLEAELEWRRPEGRSTTTRFDCLIHVLLDSLRQKYLGVSETAVTYSMMIRAGLIEREEALRRTEREIKENNQFVEPFLREVLSRIDAADKYDELLKLWTD